MRIFVVLSVFGCLMGCMTELTPEAQRVRQISADAALNCTFVGPVSGMEMMGLSTAHDSMSALNKVRNETAVRGGNAFVLTGSSSNLDASLAQADAYLCG